MNSSIFSRLVLGVGLAVAPLEVRDDPLEACGVVALTPKAVAVADLDALAAGAVEEDLAPAWRRASATASRRRCRSARRARRSSARSSPSCCRPTARARPAVSKARRPGTTRSGSISSCEPSPVQRSQAALRGVEREIRGSSSAFECRTSGRRTFSENVSVSPSASESPSRGPSLTETIPSARRGRGLDRVDEPLAHVGAHYQPVRPTTATSCLTLRLRSR